MDKEHTPINDLSLGRNASFGIGRASRQTLQGAAAQDLVLQSEGHAFSPESGWTTTSTWMGPYDILLSEAKKKITEYKDDDYRVTADISEGGNGFGPLTMKVPTRIGDELEYEDEDTVTWGLTGNDMEKALLTHPNLVNETIATMDTLRTFMDNSSSEMPWNDYPNGSGTKPAPTIAAWDFVHLIRFGVQTYSVSQWVLQRTSVLHAESTVKTALYSIGKQFEKAQLESLEGLPTEMMFTLPSTGTWLKRTPNVRREGASWRIEGEYWHSDGASAVLYPPKCWPSYDSNNLPQSYPDPDYSLDPECPDNHPSGVA